MGTNVKGPIWEVTTLIKRCRDKLWFLHAIHHSIQRNQQETYKDSGLSAGKDKADLDTLYPIHLIQTSGHCLGDTNNKLFVQNFYLSYYSFCFYLFFFHWLPWWLSGEESTCQAGDAGFIPGLGKFPGEGNNNPLQYSCLENPMVRGAWRATVHGVTSDSDII